jgi:hypothetical protein
VDDDGKFGIRQGQGVCREPIPWITMFCLPTPSFDYNDAELAGMRDGKNRFDPL